MHISEKKPAAPSSALQMDPADLSKTLVNFYAQNLIPKDSKF